MADYYARRTLTGKGQPLIFTFHGTGGNENQFHNFAKELNTEASVVSLRGDVSEMGALRFFKRRGEGVYDMDDLAQRTEAMIAFLSAEIETHQPSRVIGLGYSNGANILASVSLSAPDLFNDLILMHPLIPWAPAPVAGLSKARVLITAGERDPICPAPMTRALIDYYSRNGADVVTLWHEGGHEIRDSELFAVRDFTG